MSNFIISTLELSDLKYSTKPGVYIVPNGQPLVGYKKVLMRLESGIERPVILKVIIGINYCIIKPKNPHIIGDWSGGQLRTNEIFDVQYADESDDFLYPDAELISYYDPEYLYYLNTSAVLYRDEYFSYDPDVFNSPGLWFFYNREEAEAWVPPKKKIIHF